MIKITIIQSESNMKTTCTKKVYFFGLLIITKIVETPTVMNYGQQQSGPIIR
jgi:hypothetical protein